MCTAAHVLALLFSSLNQSVLRATSPPAILYSLVGWLEGILIGVIVAVMWQCRYIGNYNYCSALHLMRWTVLVEWMDLVRENKFTLRAAL